MIPWLIITLLTASVCSAAMGLAWLVGLRRGGALLVVGAGSGAICGLAVTLAHAGASGQVFGSAFGAAVGGSVWLVLWAGVRTHDGR
jgi:hypothetical protein